VGHLSGSQDLRVGIILVNLAAAFAGVENWAMPASDLAVTHVLQLLAVIGDAFATRGWAALRSLYHDEARVSSVAAGARILSADELIEVLSGIEDGAYWTDAAETQALDADAVVVSGLVRDRDEFETDFIPSAWVLTFCEELVWRSKAYASVDEAFAAYAEHGVNLGIS